MIERKADWPSALNAYLTEIQEKIPKAGLKYGEFDCAIFVNGAISAMSINKVDLLKDIRKRYSSKRGAARLINNLGGFRAAVGSVLGESHHKSFACHGDIVLSDNALGICIGKNCLFLSDGGFSFVPTSKIDCAFHV